MRTRTWASRCSTSALAAPVGAGWSEWGCLEDAL